MALREDEVSFREPSQEVSFIMIVGREGYIDVDERCRIERSLLWEITWSLAAAGNDLRVGNQLLFSKPKIVIK